MVREETSTQSERVAAVRFDDVRRDIADNATDERDDARRQVCAGSPHLHVQWRAVGKVVICIHFRVCVDRL